MSLPATDTHAIGKPHWQRCPECGGSGRDSRVVGVGSTRPIESDWCRVCHGSGRAFGAWARTPHGREFMGSG